MTFCAHSQESQIGKKYKSYFELPRESIFLHLNKTTIVQGESLYIKGYITRRDTGLPFKETSNIILSLHDEKGKQLAQKNYVAVEGSFQGDFVIDSTFSDTFYFIRAKTVWMDNFIEDDSVVDKFQVIGESTRTPVKEQSENLEIVLNPEGGKLITGIKNNIGVTLKDANGFPHSFSKATLRDEHLYALDSLKDEELGFSILQFRPSKYLSYEMDIQSYGGQNIKTEIATNQKRAVGLSVKNNDLRNIAIEIRRNSSLIETGQDDPFQIVIHNEGEAILFNVEVPNGINYASFLIEKSYLKKGVNTITLFDQNQTAVSETQYFHKAGFNRPKIESINVIESNAADSLVVEVKLKTRGKRFNLSVSTLPEQSISYEPPYNYFTSVYLKPYLSPTFDRARYIDERYNLKEDYLQSLLINYGSSRYGWDDILAYTKTNKEPAFIQGITITGKLHSKLRSKDSLYLHEGTYYRGRKIPVTNQQFQINNFFPFKNDTLRFSILQRSGRFKKVDLSVDFELPQKNEPIVPWPNRTDSRKEKNTGSEINIPSFSSLENVTELDEVILEAKKKKEVYTGYNLPSFISRKATIVTRDIINSAPKFADIIRSRGYEVREKLEFPTGGANETSEITRVVIRTRRGQQSFLSDIQSRFPSPIIYYNGAQLSHFDILMNLSTEDVESYYFDRAGSTAGARGGGGVIYINTKSNAQIIPGTKVSKQKLLGEDAYSIPLTKGFDKPKKFISPNYLTTADEAFIKYGVINWNPMLLSNEKGIFTFKIPNTEISKIVLHIEGIATDGTILSIRKSLDIDNYIKR